MFQFPAFAPLAGCAHVMRAGCPIRTPPDLIALADPRGISPLAASFVASGSQGILRVPLSRSSALVIAPADRARADRPLLLSFV